MESDEAQFHSAMAESGGMKSSLPIYGDFLRDHDRHDEADVMNHIAGKGDLGFRVKTEPGNPGAEKSFHITPGRTDQLHITMPFTHQNNGNLQMRATTDFHPTEDHAKVIGSLMKAGYKPSDNAAFHAGRLKKNFPQHFRRGTPTRLAKKDLIAGGLADHRPDFSFNPKSIRKGIKVEKEHTSNPQVAKEIAKDHLSESSTYYDDLAEMEQPQKFSESPEGEEAMEDEEAGFHRNLEQDIHDSVSWLVYADWLQEHGRDLDAMMMRHNGKWLEKQWPLIKDNIPSWYRDKGRFFLKQNQPNDRELHLDATHPPDTSHVLLLVKSKANPQKSLIVQHFIPHETIAPLIKGFEESGGLVQSSGSTPLSKETELDRIKANYPEHFRRGTPTRFSNSPEDHAAFHRAMEEDPENAPKVYADYLEENGKPEIARIIRSRTPTLRDRYPLLRESQERQGEKEGDFKVFKWDDANLLDLHALHKPNLTFSWMFQPTGHLQGWGDYKNDDQIDLDRLYQEADYDANQGKRIEKEQMSRSHPFRFAQQTNYAITRRELGSKNAQNALALTEDVLRKAKLSPYQVEKIIHQLGNVAFPSIGFQIHHDHPPENVVYASAFNGLIARQPGFLLFGGDEDGSDALYHFVVSSNIQNLPQLLNQAGFQSFWIKPTQQGSRVTVFDKGRRLRQLIERLATELAIEVTEHLGNSVIVGHRDANQARRIYREIIRDFESSGGAA